TVDGGAGNDRIVLSGVASATINAGSGADIVSISMRRATSDNNYQIKLGPGADVTQFRVRSNPADSTDVADLARHDRRTDFLSGGGGKDILIGLAGNDTLDGGTGDDAMTGGTGNDVYFVDSAGDTVTENAGEGTDEVRTTTTTYTLGSDVENLTGLGNVNQSL